MAVRLKDIAEETGFSINTVSLALQSSSRISASTRQIIENAAKRLHYIPNSTTRFHAAHKREYRSIAFVVPELVGQIQMQVAQAISDRLEAKGYFLQVASCKEYGEIKTLKFLHSQGVEGFFMFPMTPFDLRLLECVRESDVPIVFLSFGADLELVTDAVYVDRMQASYIVTRHLLELGHRRIMYIANASHSIQQMLDVERYHGHVKALNEYGLEYDPNYTFLCDHPDLKKGYESAKTMIRRTDATALYCTNDPMASGALSYLLQKGKRVPQDYSIVSNDSTEVARFASVPITASVYPVQELADKAAEIMLLRIEQPQDPTPSQRIAIPVTLDIRESTGAPRTN
ncbi:MAG TPA: LacI family DNA-binding transcriptional regulator [Candidatus Aphodomonas merdavium]|nr:LacI family DNA-binding transcriptional regulator [Candidatus Aphodomonas merdavium]